MKWSDLSPERWEIVFAAIRSESRGLFVHAKVCELVTYDTYPLSFQQ
jgi:hypothetical protein